MVIQASEVFTAKAADDVVNGRVPAPALEGKRPSASKPDELQLTDNVLVVIWRRA